MPGHVGRSASCCTQSPCGKMAGNPAPEDIAMSACVLVALMALAGDPIGPGDHVRSLKIGDASRSYLVHVPPKYDAKKPTPVVLVLHGAGTNGAITVSFCGTNKKADEAGFIAVYPNGTGLAGLMLTWNAGGFRGKEGKADDVAYIAKVLDDLATVANVDPKRVYATGMSNGGMMCYRLACRAFGSDCRHRPGRWHDGD